MKHTLIMGTAALVLSACTCTCPERQYDFQPSTPAVQYEFQQPSHMMAFDGDFDSSANFEYRRYTQISYTQPQQPEVVYYPVYQPMPRQPQYRDCPCRQYSPCGC